MLRIVIMSSVVLGLVASSVWTTRRSAAIDAAAALLLDNQKLCEDLARGLGVASAGGQAARRALGRETLEIAAGILERCAPRTAEVRLLERAAMLQRRLCIGTRARGETEAVIAEAAAVRPQLLALAPEEGERSRILDRFLDRRERAVVDAIDAVRDEPAGVRQVLRRAAAESGRRDRRASVPPPRAVPEAGRRLLGGEAREQGRTSSAVDPHETLVAREAEAGPARPNSPRETSARDPAGPSERTGSDGQGRAEGRTLDRQTWDPEPEELSRRRRARQQTLETRISAWRPLLARELGPLVALRSELARQLESHSLEQVRSLCGRLGEVAAEVDYGVVLASPVRAARTDLDRMLGGYVSAGRWCREGRFSFAWMEITGSDEHWSRVRSLLGLLER